MRDPLHLELLKRVVDRGMEMAYDFGYLDIFENRSAVATYIVSCHDDCVPLRLKEMLSAPDSEFAHDFFGILRHYDLRERTMQDCFMPRFALEQGLPA